MSANLENLAVTTGLENVSFHSNVKGRQCQKLLKLLHNCTYLTCQHSNVKILQARLQHMCTMDFHMFKVDLEKAEEPGFKLPTSIASFIKQESSRKISTLLYCLCLNPLTVWIPTNCGKFFKKWEYQTILPVSREICMQVKKNSQNQTWN